MPIKKEDVMNTALNNTRHLLIYHEGFNIFYVISFLFILHICGDNDVKFQYITCYINLTKKISIRNPEISLIIIWKGTLLLFVTSRKPRLSIINYNRTVPWYQAVIETACIDITFIFMKCGKYQRLVTWNEPNQDSQKQLTEVAPSTTVACLGIRFSRYWL